MKTENTLLIAAMVAVVVTATLWIRFIVRNPLCNDGALIMHPAAVIKGERLPEYQIR